MFTLHFFLLIIVSLLPISCFFAYISLLLAWYSVCFQNFSCIHSQFLVWNYMGWLLFRAEYPGLSADLINSNNECIMYQIVDSIVPGIISMKAQRAREDEHHALSDRRKSMWYRIGSVSYYEWSNKKWLQCSLQI